jgi:hypothetical protein
MGWVGFMDCAVARPQSMVGDRIGMDIAKGKERKAKVALDWIGFCERAAFWQDE